jgi:uncharacterized protein
MRVLAVTGGHSFDPEAFGLFLESMPCDVTWVEHPEALALMSGDELDTFDVTLHYDMPGARPEPVLPPEGFAQQLRARTERGRGFVVLHHAIASWPAWPVWADLVGGQYLYRPGEVRQKRWPDSGFREEVPQHLSPVDPTHPVLDGLGDGLDLVDETYLCPVFEHDVTPLLLTDAPIDDSVHTSTVEATDGPHPDGPEWRHPAGSKLAAWTRTAGRSRVVYIQPGDTGRTLGDPGYRRLVANALRWVDVAGRAALS